MFLYGKSDEETVAETSANHCDEEWVDLSIRSMSVHHACHSHVSLVGQSYTMQSAIVCHKMH